MFQKNKNKKAFSNLEIAVAFSVFFIFLSFLFPNMLLCYKSYEKTRELFRISHEEQELERLLVHLLKHRISYLSPNLPPCFILKTENSTFIAADVHLLQSLRAEQGDVLMIQCMFQEDKNQYLEKTFLLRFFKNNLCLEQYRSGYFQTGERIDILKNVQGYFLLQESIVRICYTRKNRNKNYENDFYIPS